MVVVVIGISSRVCIEKTATFRYFEKLLQAQVLGLKYRHTFILLLDYFVRLWFGQVHLFQALDQADNLICVFFFVWLILRPRCRPILAWCSLANRPHPLIPCQLTRVAEGALWAVWTNWSGRKIGLNSKAKGFGLSEKLALASTWSKPQTKAKSA